MDAKDPISLNADQEPLDEDERLLNEFRTGGKYLTFLNHSNDPSAQLIHAAASTGNLNIVKILVKKDPSEVNNKKNAHNVTPLMYAAARGEIEVVKYLIDQKADLNALTLPKDTSDGAATALLLAIRKKQGNIALLLIEKGANFTVKVGDGEQAIHLAAAKGQLDVVKAILTKNPKLLEQPDIAGETPLLYAARAGKKNVVEYLLQQKANVNVTSAAPRKKYAGNGKTPLYFAIENCSYKKRETYNDIALLLIDAGANLTVKVGELQLQPIHMAAEKGCSQVIKKLLEKDPTLLEQTDASGQTALLWAAAYGRLDIVKFLLGKNAQVNVANNNPSSEHYQKNVLYCAIANDYKNTSILLVNAGATITAPANKKALENQFEKISNALFKRKKENDDPKVKEILEDIYFEARLSYRKALHSSNYSEIALLTTTLFVINAAMENATEDSLKACLRCAEKLNNNHSFGKKLGGLILMLVGALTMAAGFLLSIGGSAASLGLAAPLAAPAGIGIAASGAVLATGGAFLFFNGCRKGLPDHVHDLVKVLENKLTLSKQSSSKTI